MILIILISFAVIVQKRRIEESVIKEIRSLAVQVIIFFTGTEVGLNNAPQYQLNYLSSWWFSDKSPEYKSGSNIGTNPSYGSLIISNNKIDLKEIDSYFLNAFDFERFCSFNEGFLKSTNFRQLLALSGRYALAVVGRFLKDHLLTGLFIRGH